MVFLVKDDFAEIETSPQDVEIPLNNDYLVIPGYVRYYISIKFKID